MAGTPTRCGFCGRNTITRAGRCPGCGQPKAPPRAVPMEPPPARSAWREVGGQVAPALAALVLIVIALVIGSQLLLYLGILALCAMGVLLAVAHFAD
jgi:hypothetical protein